MLSAGEHRRAAVRGLRRGVLLLGLSMLVAWGLLKGAEAVIMAGKVNTADHAVAREVSERACDPDLCPTRRAELGSPERPRLYFNPRKNRVELIAYGLLDVAAQQRVIDRLRAPLPRPVLLRFYEREIMVAAQGGYMHGKERLLREVELR
ncbi:hypothetical protein J7U46_21830 [Pelomonas sp. V22]|uniref:hypothetical protein n=1 Tax=Pelomonas sp. V22 TaxID=2822139 RepID=UPI0024A82B5E|nr:hypothetical protein [Pelomonas sp. V22]MDI4635721.1 hypothetical protein [Pelomonas sp. V22]